MQHTTCEFVFSLNFKCTIALCKFCKFCSVLFVPLLFALHCIACAAFAVLIDKAGVQHKCKFCSCSKANVFSDAKCNCYPGASTYLVSCCFLAQQSGLALLRTVHSFALFISFHTKVREFCSLGINPKICPKELTVNTNPNSQFQITVVPRDTVAPCPYVYRHSGVHTV